MSDPRRSTPFPIARARDADGQCRGIGRSAPAGVVRAPSAEGATAPARPADAPVVAAVGRDADPTAVSEAIARAATQSASERAAAQSGRPAPAGGGTGTATPSRALEQLLEQLRATLACFVEARRAAGAPVERVIPEVKALVREAAAHERWYDPTEQLMTQVVRWTIAAYYGTSEPSRVATLH